MYYYLSHIAYLSDKVSEALFPRGVQNIFTYLLSQ